MFAGSQIATNKLIPRRSQKELIDEENEDKTAENLVRMPVIVPRSKGGIVAENSTEKFERKTLAEERKHERNVEKQKIARQMENLMDKVLHDSSLTKNEEKDLRHRIKTIVEKINKDVEKNDDASIDSPDSVKNNKSDSVKQPNRGAFLLWYDKGFTQ